MTLTIKQYVTTEKKNKIVIEELHETTEEILNSDERTEIFNKPQ